MKTKRHGKKVAVTFFIRMSQSNTKILKEIYRILYGHFGPQYWWPGQTRFEIIIGAILTQNTNWGNVEKAIKNLKRNHVLTPQAMKDITEKQLAGHIQSAGYFNVKARRIKNFVHFLFEAYGGRLNKMGKEECQLLRHKLLEVNGIGPETADSILLYAFDKTVFVVDAYTKRILERHGIIDGKIDYHTIQKIFMDALPKDRQMFNEYHALIVRIGKNFCKPTPRCERCPLNVL